VSAVAAPSDADEQSLGLRVAGILAALRSAGSTVAAAESLTGGLLTGALTSVPGSSAVVRGGVVAYATDLKAALLGVDALLLDAAGPVDDGVAREMARGARERLGATHGVATTGEAGPDSASGQPVGTVHVAVCGPGGTTSRSLHLGGDRAAVRQGAVAAAIELLAEVLGVR
jgi:nicotinamide-nucleotide amidase